MGVERLVQKYTKQGLDRAERIAVGLRQVRNYDGGAFRADSVASVTVVALLIPAAMAQAQLAGLEPVTGLYTAMAAMLAYALFATSRNVMVGPESSVAVLVAAAVGTVSARDPERAAELAALLALMVGVIMIVAGILRLGFIADFLSKPLLVGYINGTALIVIVSQLGNLFGLSMENRDFFPRVGELVRELGDTHWPTLVTGLGVIAGILLLRRISRHIPSALVAVIVTTALAALFNFSEHGIAVVGEIPAGLPSPEIPHISVADIVHLAPAAMGIALLSFADTVLTGRTFAERNQTPKANRELIAAGAGDVAVGFFRGFPISASNSRTLMNRASGGQTQAVGVFAAVLVGIFLLFLTGLLDDLPIVTLAGIIIVASTSLIDVKTIRDLWKVDRVEAVLGMATTVGVLAIGVLGGIMMAAVFALIYVIWLLARPHVAVLGQDPAIDSYHEIQPDGNPQAAPGVVVIRFDAPLFFGNASYFLERTRALLAAQEAPVRWLILDCQGVVSIDTTAMEAVSTLMDDLDESGIGFMVARSRTAVRKQLRRSGLTARIGEQHFFPTMRTAVGAASAL